MTPQTFLKLAFQHRIIARLLENFHKSQNSKLFEHPGRRIGSNACPFKLSINDAYIEYDQLVFCGLIS